MDPIMIEKLKAMKCHRRSKTTKLLQDLLKFFLATIFLGLFLSSPLWLPFTFSLLKTLLMVIVDTKCLFVIFNIIVIVLFGQSKLSIPSPSYDIYDEYVSRNKSLQRLNISENAVKKDVVLEDREESKYEEVEEGDLNGGLDELNKRVEDFIARVNKQRRIEARTIDYYGNC
ncbi:uncharacterized protein A4U43_UnF5930 [Asparagus officinalis]|uniref:Uncharacterized protein n=1 Tax=Asparagus officinalis TaxID=4686 RepID=A0A1R3L6L9_ASPOF|nr:uncharacterized protein LOC109827616 [Asparagus officinalis]ONK55248.1 uncharacterized protein A4U43_UnF5930 [Asparagus officinalis]